MPVQKLWLYVCTHVHVYTYIVPDYYQYLVCKDFSLTFMVRENWHYCNFKFRKI